MAFQGGFRSSYLCSALLRKSKLPVRSRSECVRTLLSARKNLCIFPAEDKFHTSAAQLAFKSDLTIKWIRPEPISVHDLRKSGDLEPMPSLDMSEVPELLRDLPEFQMASDDVKKLFTFEYNKFRYAVHQYKKDMMKKTKMHMEDTGSFEAAIGALTANIRVMQRHMEKFPQDKNCKVKLVEAIDRRRKFLKHLRRQDYKKFEWVLEQLNIIYKPSPLFSHWVTRRSSLRRLTDKHCDKIMQERLDSYKKELEAQQKDFLEDKLATLKWILQERKDLGLLEEEKYHEDIQQEEKELQEAQDRLEKIRLEKKVEIAVSE